MHCKRYILFSLYFISSEKFLNLLNALHQLYSDNFTVHVNKLNSIDISHHVTFIVRDMFSYVSLSHGGPYAILGPKGVYFHRIALDLTGATYPPIIMRTNIHSFEMESPQRATPVSRDLQNSPRLFKFTEKRASGW